MDRALLTSLALAAGIILSPSGAGALVVNTLPPAVYAIPGSAAVLSRQAAPCADEVFRPALGKERAVQSANFSTGVIVADTTFRYEDKLLSRAREGRSTVTLRADPGRLRVTQSEIELVRGDSGYQPVKGWVPDPEEDSLLILLHTQNDRIADCVRAKLAPPRRNWWG